MAAFEIAHINEQGINVVVVFVDPAVAYKSSEEHNDAEKLRTGLKVGKNIRGILVHGGARKLSAEVRRDSKRAPQIELVQFSVSVGFTPSL